MKSRSASLTGVTGFLGWHIAEALRDAGWRVRGIVRPESGRPSPEGIDVVSAPLASASLTSAIDGCDLVVHCAGVVRARNEAAFMAVNVEGTRAVVEAANATGARVVLISSLAAAGTGTPDRRRREEDAPQPVNAYGRSKLASELVVRERARTPWTIIRPSAVYGARDKGFLPLFRLAQRGVFLLAAPAATAFTLIDVDDLARAIVLVANADHPAGETLFVGHPDPQTTEQILRTLAGVLHRTYRPRRIPAIAVRAAASIGDLAWRLGYQTVMDTGRLAEFNAGGFVCAVDRVREVLGFTAATPFGEGFERTASWYQEQRWI